MTGAGFGAGVGGTGAGLGGLVTRGPLGTDGGSTSARGAAGGSSMGVFGDSWETIGLPGSIGATGCGLIGAGDLGAGAGGGATIGATGCATIGAGDCGCGVGTGTDTGAIGRAWSTAT